MQSVSDIKRFIKSYNHQITETRSDISAIGAKIDALEHAKHEVNKARSELDGLSNSVQRIEAGNRWKGKRRNGFDKGIKTTVPGEANKYGNKIDGFEHYIDREITRLKTQRSELTSSLFSVEQNLKRMQKALVKAAAERRA